MSNGIMGRIFTFSLGAAVGAFVAWKLLESGYEQKIQDEINEIRKERLNNHRESTEGDTESKPEVKDDNQTEYTDILAAEGYVKYSDIKKAELENEFIHCDNNPYVIAPEEFDMVGYKTECLVYYADHVLTNMSDEPIEDVDETVGVDSLNRFGEFEDDSVHVRNDELRTDYQILLSQKKYSDVVKRIDPLDVEE